MNNAETFRRLTSTSHIRDDLRAKSVRAAALTWIGGAGDFILRLGSTAALARMIVPEDFGLVMMVMAVTALADQFRDLGLSTVTVQRPEITHEEISNLFWINVTAGVVIALLVCAVSPLIAAYYNEPRLVVPTCILATNFICGGLMVQHQALLTRQLKLGSTSVVRLLSSVISTILAVAMAWLGFGYWALVWREVLRSSLLALGMWAAFPWVPGLPSRRTNVAGLISFGADLSLANIAGSISGAVDRFLLGRFWGAAPVALYRQAYQLLVLPTEQLISPIYQVTQPGLSMLQNDPARFCKFYGKVLTMACVAAMPLSAFVMVYSSEITRVVLGTKWAASGPLLAILAVSSFVKQPVGSTAFVLIACGRSRAYLALSILQNAATVLFMCVGVRWGVAGIACAEVAGTYLMIGPRLYYTFRDSPMSAAAFLSTAARPAAASLMMAAALLGLQQSVPPVGAPAILGIASVAGAFVFFATWALLPGGRAELLELFGDVRSILQKRVGSPMLVKGVALAKEMAR